MEYPNTDCLLAYDGDINESDFLGHLQTCSDTIMLLFNENVSKYLDTLEDSHRHNVRFTCFSNQKHIKSYLFNALVLFRSNIIGELLDIDDIFANVTHAYCIAILKRLFKKFI